MSGARNELWQAVYTPAGDTALRLLSTGWFLQIADITVFDGTPWRVGPSPDLYASLSLTPPAADPTPQPSAVLATPTISIKVANNTNWKVSAAQAQTVGLTDVAGPANDPAQKWTESPGESGDSRAWEGWSHAGRFNEAVPAGAEAAGGPDGRGDRG